MLNTEELLSFIMCCVDTDESFKKHKNLIIVGENSSGKTQFLSMLFSKAIISNSVDYYFIDAKNRSVTDDSDNLLEKRYYEYDILDLLKERTSRPIMSIRDYFTDHDPGPLVTISELINGYREYEKLFTDIYQESIVVKLLSDPEEYNDKRDMLLGTSKREKVLINDVDISSLSSSEAAELRIIMEVNNAFIKGCKVVVIDEFDIHFTNTRMVEFMEMLTRYYFDLRFIFVIHNADLVVDLNNIEACLFHVGRNGGHHLIDCNDIKEYGQVDRLKSKYSDCINKDDIILEQCVDEFVKTGGISQELVVEFQNIKVDNLAGRALVWYRYVDRGLRNA